MISSPIWIIMAIVVLAILAVLSFLASKRGKEKRLTPLAGLAFVFVLAGVLFGNDRILGYSLLGVGVVLAIVDMFNKLRKK